MSARIFVIAMALTTRRENRSASTCPTLLNAFSRELSRLSTPIGNRLVPPKVIGMAISHRPAVVEGLAADAGADVDPDSDVGDVGAVGHHQGLAVLRVGEENFRGVRL